MHIFIFRQIYTYGCIVCISIHMYKNLYTNNLYVQAGVNLKIFIFEISLCKMAQLLSFAFDEHFSRINFYVGN